MEEPALRVQVSWDYVFVKCLEYRERGLEIVYLSDFCHLAVHISCLL